jgi:soluble lytic murein transglycosylase
MQLIPTTAQATARKEGLKYSKSALLDDPLYNMTIGSAHLSHLISRFSGSWIMTFAGYNAGVNRVDQWVEAYGDPRSPTIDPLDWIEQIPFEETRNYVQRVLENSQIYRSRLTKGAIAGSLAYDIERGGAARRVAAISSIGSPGVIPDIQSRIVAFAEPVLNPLPEAPEALAHIRLKPQKEAQIQPSVSKSQPRIGPRLNFRQKKQFPSQQPLRHDDLQTTPASPGASVEQAKPIAIDDLPPLLMEPVDGDAEAAVEAEPAYAEEALVEPSPDGVAIAGDSAEAPPEECVTYSDFIAETAKEEASADDLNAGALAELIGDGTACK